MPQPERLEVVALIAAELKLTEHAVEATLQLLDAQATVPFIARYRKEATSGLDEVQIRTIAERRDYLNELADRRQTILTSVDKQGKLTPELQQSILRCTTKAELEDLYQPFKPKRRTRGQVAIERGLQPLADLILAQPLQGAPNAKAKDFVAPDQSVPDAAAALQGARDIIAERVADHPTLRTTARETYRKQGRLACKVVKKALKEQEGPTKFEQFYDFSEPAQRIPAHRLLAIRRGEQQGLLRARVEIDDNSALVRQAERAMGLKRQSPFAKVLTEAVEDGVERLLQGHAAGDVQGELMEAADRAAVTVFAENLRQLLLAAPLGERSVLGIDPGFRTGCKCALVDQTGKMLMHLTIYPHSGEGRAKEAQKTLLQLLKKAKPAAIAVGNGTAGRETEAFVRDLCRDNGLPDLWVVSVNEAGASVYSASDVARHEFPDLDVSIRGAISIARRLQDPLAELVKIEPQAIGVGQYQHDVPANQLSRKLGEVVESCVNHVGVELNTASVPLLAHVSGLNKTAAERIVARREQKGPFHSRKELLKVTGIGPRTFEQAAGFLRIRDGKHPLDRSAVHPERYELVERMAKDLGTTVATLVEQPEWVDRIAIDRYIDDKAALGEHTLRDILMELKKPGRDPRDHFEPVRFRDDVHTMEDLREGMQLEGVVTNVTAFGAFVDIGVHQDGLVHISQLADRFVRDPAEVVKVGDRIKVRVLSVEPARKRISLSAKSVDRDN